MDLQLGTTSLHVSSLCFGANVFGWTCDEKKSFYLLDELYDNGINFIDTANNYSHWVAGNTGGESESIIGKWLFNNKKRHDFTISTKVGGSFFGVERGLSKDQIITEVENSLRRLKTDYIDLYFAHHDDCSLDAGTILESFNILIKQGKVRYLGASNVSSERIEQSNLYASEHELKGYQVIQPLYNLYDRALFEQQYQSIAEQQTLGVMSYFSLASGFLSGKYSDVGSTLDSSRKDFLVEYFDQRGFSILRTLEQISLREGVSMAAIALAWQLNAKVPIVPIVSATSKEQLDELLIAQRLFLSPHDLELLDEASRY